MIPEDRCASDNCENYKTNDDGRKHLYKNIMIATMTISAIIPTITDPARPAKSKDYQP
jgi:hypothetical protein